jgi:hypothetical protein
LVACFYYHNYKESKCRHDWKKIEYEINIPHNLDLFEAAKWLVAKINEDYQVEAYKFYPDDYDSVKIPKKHSKEFQFIFSLKKTCRFSKQDIDDEDYLQEMYYNYEKRISYYPLEKSKFKNVPKCFEPLFCFIFDEKDNSHNISMVLFQKSWERIRWLWVAHLKENSSYCNLARLPKDMIKLIASFA